MNEDSIYDFQSRISKFVNKKVHFIRTTYVSPVDHAIGVLKLDDILSDSELYEEMLKILKKAKVLKKEDEI